MKLRLKLEYINTVRLEPRYHIQKKGWIFWHTISDGTLSKSDAEKIIEELMK